MITQILSAIFLLGVCIFFHELGHFLMGKLVGVQPRIFSIGYGRALFFRRKGRTIYQVTAIPIGGYVQFYGDDITRDHVSPKKGHFFSVGPWKRILIALGGPLFSVLLGLIVIFILFSSGWQPITNEIVPIEAPNVPAWEAGLKRGDRIVSVNGHSTVSFEEVNYRISLAEDPNLTLVVDRGGKEKEIEVKALSNEGEPFFIGVRPAGDEYLIIQKNIYVENQFFRKDDKIISVDGKPVKNIEELRQIVDQKAGSNVKVELKRSTGSLFSPGEEETLTYNVPVKIAEYVEFTNVRDLQTEKSIPQIVVGDWDEQKVFQKIRINGESSSDWGEFKEKLSGLDSQKARFKMGAVPVETAFKVKQRGMLGVSLFSAVEPEKARLPMDFVSVTLRTLHYPVFVLQNTLTGLYRIFQGKLSFSKSISGPVKIMAIAAESVSTGWSTYWFLLANITIVLGVMNLLPIPVLDGGHIVFYLIEALYKPLSPKAIASAVRIGMVFLLTLGAYVIWLDISDLFKRFTG